jgi:hypothetical protein
MPWKNKNRIKSSRTLFLVGETELKKMKQAQK